MAAPAEPAEAPIPFVLETLEEEPEERPSLLMRTFLPPGVRTGADLQRRALLLLATTCATVVLCLFFASQMRMADGGSGAALTLLSFCLLTLLNPVLLRLTGRIKLAGTLLTLEMLAVIGTFTWAGGGLENPAFLWNLMVPWIGAVIVGPWLGFVCAGLVVAETLALYLLGPATTVSAPDAQWLWLLGIVELVTCVAFLAWIHESATLRDLRASNRRLQRTHRALARSEARFRSLVQHSSDIIALIDGRGRVLYASPSLLRITGLAPAEVVGLPVFGFIHREDRVALRSLVEMLFEGDGPRDVFIPAFRFRTADDDWRWLDANVTNLLHKDAVRALVVHVHDVTERKRIQEQLIAAKDSAEQLARAKTAFLASMSHEIRTPLTSILGFAQVLEAEADSEQNELIGFIRRSGRRLLDTINSVLDLARLEAGELAPRYDEVDVAEEVEETVLLLQPLAQEKGLTLGAVVDVAAHAELDRDFLRRILTNLIGNAIKFTEEGGVTVYLDADRTHFRLRVTDTGIGIDEAFRPHLFAEFKQANSKVRQEQPGSGLGLAITHRLVRLLEGEIEVESEVGRGSTFTITLPLRRRAMASARPAIAA